MNKNHISRRLILNIVTPGVDETFAGCSGGNDGSLINRYFDMCLEIPYFKLEGRS